VESPAHVDEARVPVDGPVDGLVDGPPARRTAAFFDLDKTIIARSSTLAFSRPFYECGLINRRTVLKSAYAQFVYLAGGADHDQMERMRQYLSALVTGWDVQQVKDVVAETLHDLIDPLVYDEAATLIEEHHTAGRDVVIVSSSGAEVVAPIGELIGADRRGRHAHDRRGRPLHGRARVLRLRGRESRRDPPARRERGV
jgi:phosphoserine phosphatase